MPRPLATATWRPRAALFEACIPVVPYVPAIASRRQGAGEARGARGRARRVALVIDAAGSMHGVTHTIERIRENGVPGCERRRDRHRPASRPAPAGRRRGRACPFYAGLAIGVPSVPELVRDAAPTGATTSIHVASPGPAGIGAIAIARIRATPLVGSYHTELAAYAGDAKRRRAPGGGGRAALALFYGQCSVVLSPSPSADQSLARPRDRPGADRPLGARRRHRPLRPGASATPTPTRARSRCSTPAGLTHEKGVDLLADTFLRAHERDPRLHLLLAGGGPEEDALRERLGERATFLGWLDREELATAYASADVFLFCSRTDTYGQVIARGAGQRPAGRRGRRGRPRDADRATATPGGSARPTPRSSPPPSRSSPPLRSCASASRAAALAAVRGRTWEAALRQLAAGYEVALGGAATIRLARSRLSRLRNTRR